MTWKIEVSPVVQQDIALVFDHLAESYIGFGETPAFAVEQAKKRIDVILSAMKRIAAAPYRGESHEDWLSGLRHLTLERTIYWYQVDEACETIRVPAIFYGGQDHVRQMLLRLLRDQR